MNFTSRLSNTAIMAVLIFLLPVSTVMAESDWDRLDAFVERGMELWHVPGMAVTVVSGSDTLYQRGFGTTALSGGMAVDQHTLFANASTTKAMVAAGLLMLADDGKLTLDDTVITHIPEVHFQDPLLTSQLTIRDLLAHRTGLPSTDGWTFFQEMPLDEQIRRLGKVRPAAPVRTRHIYQNTMYELAGLVIERLSGQRWDHFLTDRLWRPIGMLETYGNRAQIPEGRSHVLPYFYRDDMLVQAEWDFPADLADAAGSAWTSIHDMGLWTQFLLRGGVTSNGERLISEPRFDEIFKPQSLIAEADFYPTAALTNPDWTSYGLGWFQQNFQGRKIDFHTGSLSGLIAIIGIDRGRDRGVVVLGNRDHAEMRHAVLWEVMDEAPAESRPDWNRQVFDLYAGLADDGAERLAGALRKRLTGTSRSLPDEHYLGAWESAALGRISVEKTEDGWVLRTRKVDMPMTYWHVDSFAVEYEPWGLHEFAQYRIGPDGSIEKMELFGEEFVPVADEE